VTAEATRAAILRILGDIAPDADLSRVRGDAPLRDELDIDSMDFLNLVIAVASQLAVEIPERDYARIATLDAMVAYVEAHTAA